MVEAAHDAGLRVMADFVVNHVHEDHVYAQEHPEWFNQGCICGSDMCDWTERRLDCLFMDYMPDLDWKNRDASEQIIADALWWAETFDLDGLRVDAVKHVDDHAMTNLATRINERFEATGTDFYLKGETAMGWSGHSLEDNAEQYQTSIATSEITLGWTSGFRSIPRSSRQCIHYRQYGLPASRLLDKP